jgi:uncharacterized membrane protein YjfL (UPF0719 family)
MSGDEVVVTLVAIALGPAAWIFWLFRMHGIQHGRRALPVRVVAGALATCAVLVFVVLDTVASFDVVDDPRYQFMYLVLGLAWLRVAAETFPFVGLSARDDVGERGNTAAALAVGGALIGAALCYAGGNIGSGPGWWVVVFSAGLSTGTFLAGWLVLATFTPVADSVTIDRDAAAGLRLAAFLVALGLLLGRGVAGDWHSGPQTVADFVVTLPLAAVLLAIALLVERAIRLTPDRPHGALVSSGLAPSLIYLAFGAVGVRLLGWPT